MTTTEIVAIAGAIVTGLGGPPAVRGVIGWLARRREKREELEEKREEHRHKEALERIDAEETTGKHQVQTIAGLARVVHEQSTEILMLRAEARDHDKNCDDKIARALSSMRSPGFRVPRPGAEEE